MISFQNNVQIYLTEGYEQVFCQVVKPLLKENYATRLWQEQSNFRKYLQGTLLFPSNKDILNLVVVLLG